LGIGGMVVGHPECPALCWTWKKRKGGIGEGRRDSWEWAITAQNAVCSYVRA